MPTLKHGHGGRKHRTPEYRAWAHIVDRCCNPRDKGYKNYGGRGIKICRAWRRSFETFLRDMGPRPSPQHSIDRINNDGDYKPSNCRWATTREQLSNMRKTHFVTYKGNTVPLASLSHLFVVRYSTVQERIRRGWTVERAMTVPVQT